MLWPAHRLPKSYGAGFGARSVKDKLGGRRFLMACGILLSACVMLWFGKLAGAEWVSVVTWVGGLYIAGNVAQRGVEAAQAVKSQ